MQGQLKRNEENALQSERRSALKKILTGPTLLEMSGKPTIHSEDILIPMEHSR